MKLEVVKENTTLEMNLTQITQLCGKDIVKKAYILESLSKHFSGARYAEYEENMKDNIMLDGKKVGRKYFAIQRIQGREDLLGMIKLGKSSLMMKYLSGRFTDFACQKELDVIAEHLEKLYLEINAQLAEAFRNIEISYERKNLLDMIQSSMILGKEEKCLEQLTNGELLDTYIDLLGEIQEKTPEKCMVIIEDIDHLMSYSEYCAFYQKLKVLCRKYDMWFVLSSSMEGFVVLEREFLTGVHIVNDVIYNLPQEEQILGFMEEQYPYHRKWEAKEALESLRCIIQEIGQEEYTIDLQSMVMLRMINNSLCIKCKHTKGINSLEKSFLASKDMV